MTNDSSDACQSGEPGDDAGRIVRFETAIEELETIVATLEGGDVSLEEALERFERGVALARDCQTLLRNAELRVDQLLSDYGPDSAEQLADFDAPTEPGDSTST